MKSYDPPKSYGLYFFPQKEGKRQMLLSPGKNGLTSLFKVGNPLAIYRGLSGARNPEKVLKKSPGASDPGTPRECGKSLEKVFRDLFETFSRLPGTFSRLFPDSRGVPGRRPRSDFFLTFFRLWARRARETPVNGQRVPKFKEVTGFSR